MNKFITGTNHLYDFISLSPDDFERFCEWIVDYSGEYKRVEPYGGTSDGQRDILGFTDSESLHLYQCKRYTKIAFGDFKKELDGITQHIENGGYQRPDRIVFVIACSISARAKDKTKEYANILGLPIPEFWELRILDRKIKQAPEVSKEFFQRNHLSLFGSEPKPCVDTDSQITYSTDGYRFTVINHGDISAIDCKWSLLGFKFEYEGTTPAFSLAPGGSPKSLRLALTGSFMGLDPIKELRLHFEYRDNRGNWYYSERMLNTELVKSKSFYIIKPETGDFIFPKPLFKYALLKIDTIPSGRVQNRWEVNFSYKEKTYILTVNISPRGIRIYGPSQEDHESVIQELSKNKITQMIENGKLKDEVTFKVECFNTDNYEIVKQMRDSIK